MEYPRMCPGWWLADHNNCAMCIPQFDFVCPFQDMQLNYYRHWKWCNQNISEEFGSKINENGNYKITLDVQYFRPNEIDVKVSDSEIIVEGRHEERADTHGYVTRQFKRRYPLPKHCPSENVTSTLSSDGVLTIIAEKISAINQKEIIVPIKICSAFYSKAQVENNISSQLQGTEDTTNKNINQQVFQDGHNRILKQEMLKDTISETNGTCSKATTQKESIDIVKTVESAEKSSLGLDALTNPLGQINANSTSKLHALEMTDSKSAAKVSDIKNMSEMCDIKFATKLSDIEITSKMSDTKSASQISDIKCTSNISDIKNVSKMTEIKNTSGMSDIKNITDMSGMNCTLKLSNMKSALETSDVMTSASAAVSSKKNATESYGMKDMSKILMEQSSSSYTSSLSASSSTKVGRSTGESFSDIGKELLDAAENV